MLKCQVWEGELGALAEKTRFYKWPQQYEALMQSNQFRFISHRTPQNANTLPADIIFKEPLIFSK